MATHHAFETLAKTPTEVTGVCVLFGDEPFLKRLVRDQLTSSILADDDDAPFATFSGKTCEWRDVADELFTVSLFSSGPRLVVVEDGDEFVTRCRTQLEDLVARDSVPGVLILDVTKWASNTRLYKMTDQQALQIECRAPQKGGRSKGVDEPALAKWLVSRAKRAHQVSLEKEAASELVALVGVEFGLLEQALAKLALFVEAKGSITASMVQEIVGGWRARTTWDLIEAAAGGNAAAAVEQLERLLQAGEHANALFGQISWSLRRFAAATRIYEQAQRDGNRMPLQQALEQAGFRKWPREALVDAEKQLKQLGRTRAAALYRWLLELDLSLKGSHSSAERARHALEMLFFRMSELAKPQAAR